MGAFAALDQRIATRSTLTPMDLAESAAYLRHHLTLVGRTDPLFADDAIARLHRVAGGLPRKLNNAATAALTAAAAEASTSSTTPAPNGQPPSSPATDPTRQRQPAIPCSYPQRRPRPAGAAASPQNPPRSSSTAEPCPRIPAKPSSESPAGNTIGQATTVPRPGAPTSPAESSSLSLRFNLWVLAEGRAGT
jgi:hypothetical protein